ncbi:unnamed protein product, partial [Arctogadus glacialis]
CQTHSVPACLWRFQGNAEFMNFEDIPACSTGWGRVCDRYEGNVLHSSSKSVTCLSEEPPSTSSKALNGQVNKVTPGASRPHKDCHGATAPAWRPGPLVMSAHVCWKGKEPNCLLTDWSAAPSGPSLRRDPQRELRRWA